MTSGLSVQPPMTRAEQAGTWCMRLSEGPLPSDQQAALDAWLDASPRNREAFDEAAATWREIEGAESAPEFLPLRVEALQAARRSGRRGRFLRRLPPWAAIAATLLVVVLTGAGGLWRMQAPKLYETGIGERRVIALSDGSKLSLDAATKVRVRYARDRRELRLEHGRAKFDVARDPLRPFSVAASDKVVVATGTAFSVELLQKQVRVVLYEGRVSVLGRPPSPRAKPRPLPLATRNTAADQALTPGRELVAPVGVHGAPAVVAPADPGRTLAWEAGQLVFVDEPLASAVERVNRYSADTLAVGDAAAGRVLVTGVFTAGDTQAFVEGVTAAFPLRERAGERGRVLVSSRAG